MSRGVRRITRGVGDIVRRTVRGVGDVFGGVSDQFLGTNFTGRYDTPDFNIPEPPTSDSGTSFQTGANTPTTSVGGSSDSKFDTDSIFQVNTDGQAGYRNVFEESLRKKRGK